MGAGAPASHVCARRTASDQSSHRIDHGAVLWGCRPVLSTALRARRARLPGRAPGAHLERSALGELEAAPRLHAAVLLALDDAAVAREEAALLERRAQFG